MPVRAGQPCASPRRSEPADAYPFSLIRLVQVRWSWARDKSDRASAMVPSMPFRVSWTVPSRYSRTAKSAISWLSWTWRWLAFACSTVMACWRSISSYVEPSSVARTSPRLTGVPSGSTVRIVDDPPPLAPARFSSSQRTIVLFELSRRPGAFNTGFKSVRLTYLKK